MAYTKKNGTNQNRRCWGIKKSWFCIILGILTIVVIFLLLNLWFKWIPKIYIDKYVLILVFTLIGLSLLPFAKKIKIANLNNKKYWLSVTDLIDLNLNLTPDDNDKRYTKLSDKKEENKSCFKKYPKGR